MRKVTIVALALAAAACSPVQDTKAADAQIAAFHQKLNAQDFAGLYAGSGAEWKSASSQDAMIAFLSAIHRKLGNFQSGNDVGWSDNVNTSGHFLSINYAAKYDRGAATEHFVYKIDGPAAQLVGYNINSNALIEN